MGRDATILIEGELRQFDQKRLADKGQLVVQRYVESLVTGNFMKVLKEINLTGQADSSDNIDGNDNKKV